MRYNCCSSCIYFAQEIKDATQITRKHCKHPAMEEIFGIKCGFPTGIDIVSCDWYRQPNKAVGDVVYTFSNGHQVSYIIPSVRPKCRLGAGDLKDNSKNQRIFKVNLGSVVRMPGADRSNLFSNGTDF